MVALVDGGRQRLLVTRYETADGPFHRLIGGAVEFGETAPSAVVREVWEELGLELSPEDLVRLGVLESIFSIGGTAGNEVVFVFRAAVATSIMPEERGWMSEGDIKLKVEWRSLGSADLPLYPAGVEQLLGTDGP